MLFEEIPVSTQTFTVRSNIENINLEKIFNDLNLNKKIISISFQNKNKGLTKPKKKINNNFLNCLTIIFLNNNVNCNIKIFKNGVFQIAGCKSVQDVKYILKILVEKIINTGGIFLKSKNESLFFYIISAMRNIYYNLNFQINKNQLLNIFHNENEMIVYDLFGNEMEIKIKFEIEDSDLQNRNIYKIIYDFKKKSFSEQTIKYHEYVKEINKEIGKVKKKFTTIIIFQNGKILISSIDEEIQEKYFYIFQDIIKKFEEEIKIKKKKLISLL
jgi:hypothetical protein